MPGRVLNLTEIGGSGKMRYVPLPTLHWMGLNLLGTRRRGGLGSEGGRGWPEDVLGVAGPRPASI
jgi:hypothetical protein